MPFSLKPFIIVVFAGLIVAVAVAVSFYAPAFGDERTFTDSEGNTVHETTTEWHFTNPDDGTYTEWNTQERIFRDASGKVVKKTYTRVVEKYDKKGGKNIRTFIDTDRLTPAADSPLHWDEKWETVTVDHKTGAKTTESGDAHVDMWGEPYYGHVTVTKTEPGEKPKTDKYHWCDDCEEWESDNPLVLPKNLRNPDLNYEPIFPQSGTGSGTDQGVYLPPIAGPSSMVMGTVVDSNEAGPKDYFVATVTSDGKKNFFKGITGVGSHLAIKLAPKIVVADLFLKFDAHGSPDQGAACDIGTPAHLTGTDPLMHSPSGPGIVEGSSAYDEGAGGQGFVRLHTRGNDPLDTHALLNGSARNIRTLGTSNESYLGEIKPGTPLGPYTLTLTSDGKKLNSMRFDLVSLTADPIAPSHPGAIDTVVVHVLGLPPSDTGTMDFNVTGPAQLASGGNTTSVPVTNNVARVQIRGLAEGQAIVRYHLRVRIAGYWL